MRGRLGMVFLSLRQYPAAAEHLQRQCQLLAKLRPVSLPEAIALNRLASCLQRWLETVPDAEKKKVLAAKRDLANERAIRLVLSLPDSLEKAYIYNKYAG